LTFTASGKHSFPMNGGRFRDSEAIFEYLMKYVNVEKGQATVFKLDRMFGLAEALGNPHLGRLTIHVAGSKGKGSVSTMCARILADAGFRTGIYTSPHLLRWKERIAFADREMPEEILIQSMEEILPLVEGRQAGDFPGGELPTYFELTTLLAFCAFRRTGCNAQVIEVGLGGRLDSTNIVDPDVSVITPIELEHTQFLGDTLGKIAFEKAGIIKPGKPVRIASQKEEAFNVFASVSAERASPLRIVGKDTLIDGIIVDESGTQCVLHMTGIGDNGADRTMTVRCPMPGVIQAQNMALAAEAVCTVLPGIEADHIVSGLGKARLPARFEILDCGQRMVLDGAHTPESVRHTLTTMEAVFKGPKILLFACAIDKHHGQMAGILAGHFRKCIVTTPGSFKQSSPEDVFASFVKAGNQAELEPSLPKALDTAMAAARSENAALLVTGSFYLCAEVRKILGY